MSNNDYILNLLNIEDKNIFISNNEIENKMIKGKNTKIVYGILTYKPDVCICCGVINESNNDIIKWGFKHNCKVKIPKIIVTNKANAKGNKPITINLRIILFSNKFIVEYLLNISFNNS